MVDSRSVKKIAGLLKGLSLLLFGLSGLLLVGWGLLAVSVFMGPMSAGPNDDITNVELRDWFGRYIIPSAVFGGVVFLASWVAKYLSKTLEKSERARAAHAAEVRAIEQDRQNTLSSLADVHDRAVSLKQSIPALVQSAHSNLDVAEQDYQRGAFSPFWSAIEAATMRLGELSDSLGQFGLLMNQHNNLTGKLAMQHQQQASAFPVRLGDMYAAEQGRMLCQRMNVLVGRAQTNYQFAAIYEQRRTSSILIAGFQNLGSAIHGMGAKIAGELESLRQQLPQ